MSKQKSNLSYVWRRLQTVALWSRSAALSLGALCVVLISITSPVGAQSESDWPLHGRDAYDQRHAPWSQIDRTNVNTLGLAWATPIPSRNGLNASPIIVGETLFISAPFSRVYALDMKSGRILWSFDPKVRVDLSVGESYGARVNRGVAYDGGKVFVATADCRLIALNAKTGTELWSAKDCSAANGHYKNAAPRVGGGLVFTAASGSEYGGRGFVSAYRAATGKLAWRFYTVPKPKGPQESKELEAAARTWPGPRPEGSVEGGTIWDAMTYDPELKLLYVGTGGAFPMAYSDRAPAGGDELYLESVVAIDAQTGRYVWHFQETPHDNYDYNAANHLLLADLEIGGVKRAALLTAPKNGYFYVLDRTNGQFIGAAPIARVNWASGLDPLTGRPTWNPEVLEKNLSPGKCITVYPSGWGAHTWTPMSFSPEAALVFLPIANVGGHRCRKEQVASSGRDKKDALASDDSIEDTYVVDDQAAAPGELVAWDPVSGRARWRAPLVTAYNGGAMSTGGGLVFEGTGNGFFQARNTDTGNLLWNFRVKSAIHGAPASAVVGGEQYVVVLAGDSGLLNLAFRKLTTTDDAEGPAYVLAFKLNGMESLPAWQPSAAPRNLPAQAALGTAEEIDRGRNLFESLGCAYCHGHDLNNSGHTSIPDLRRLDEAKLSLWDSIVRGGILKHSGMLGFPITPEESHELKAYVVSELRAARIAPEQSH